MKTDEVNKALTEFGKHVIERAKANLKKGGKYGTHNTSNSLSNSLSFQLKISYPRRLLKTSRKSSSNIKTFD